MKNYFILALIYLTGIAAPINQFKIPPMMQQITASMDISLAASGWLMSAFALTGFLLALPSGIMLQKVGIKNLALFALCLLLAGSVLGGSSELASVILLSRAIEGAGMSLYSVAAPAAISAWFPPQKRGIPVGIWSTWVPAGNVVIFAVAPFVNTLSAQPDWHNVWIFTSAYTAAMLVLFAAFFKMPSSAPAVSQKAVSIKNAFDIKEAWLLGIIFMLFNILTISIKTYLPSFLETVRDYPQAKAAGITTVMMVCSMIAAPLSGIISDKIKSRKKLILAACIGASITICMMFNVTGNAIAISLIFIGLAGGAMPAGVFTACTELSNDPAKSGACMSIVIFGQYIGMFAGPVFFSNIADAFNWWTAAYALLPLIGIAFLIALRLKIK